MQFITAKNWFDVIVRKPGIKEYYHLPGAEQAALQQLLSFSSSNITLKVISAILYQ